MSKGIKLLFCSTLVIFAFGCTSGARVKLPEGLPTPQIPAVEVSHEALNSVYKPVIYIAQVKDDRPSPALVASSTGETKSCQADVGLPIQYAMRKAFRSRGFNVSDKASVTLAIKIEKWIANVSSGKTVFEVSVLAEAIGPAGAAIYSNSYDSFKTADSSALNDDEIMAGLETTMADALRDLMNDEQLITILSSY